jgi:hypothetical protein
LLYRPNYGGRNHAVRKQANAAINNSAYLAQAWQAINDVASMLA